MRAALLSLVFTMTACSETDDPKSAADDTAQEPVEEEDEDTGPLDDGDEDDGDEDDGDEDDDAADDTGADDGDDTGEPDEPEPTLDEIRAAVHTWFEADFASGPRTSSSGLPDGAFVDARPGQTGRLSVPAEVLAPFDFFYRVEAADLGSVRLHRGAIDGHELWAITTTTDGDDAYVEVWTSGFERVTGGRFFTGETPVWDGFDGRVRLARLFTTVGGPSYEEGMSEPDERADAGQVPMGWTGDVQITSGSLQAAGSLLGTVDTGTATLSDAQRDIAVAAFDHLWEVHLQYAADAGRITLGGSQQGVLTIGTYTRPTSGETYTAADWRDIDDGSYVLYFTETSSGPELSVIQYDN